MVNLHNSERAKTGYFARFLLELYKNQPPDSEIIVKPSIDTEEGA